jgi:hypothetical protein
MDDAALWDGGDTEMTGDDRPGCLDFSGNRTAELFTCEVRESLAGVLRHNLYGPERGVDAGFLSASMPGRACAGQFWSRDGGTFVRELVHWGYFRTAAKVMDCALSLVEKNADGFFAFPMYWLPGQPASGHELDGTAAITIGLAHLCRRLETGDPRRECYYQFLHDASSPLAMLHQANAGRRLIAGHGEFGGGMGVDGLHCNAVQNGLCRLALMIAAEIEDEFGDHGTAARHRALALQIAQEMAKRLAAPDGGWLWCINADTRSVPFIMPRLPPAWHGFRATRWPLWTPVGVVAVDVDYRRNETSEQIDLFVREGRTMPALSISLGGPRKRHVYTMTDVSQVHLIQ